MALEELAELLAQLGEALLETDPRSSLLAAIAPLLSDRLGIARAAFGTIGDNGAVAWMDSWPFQPDCRRLEGSPTPANSFSAETRFWPVDEVPGREIAIPIQNVDGSSALVVLARTDGAECPGSVSAFLIRIARIITTAELRAGHYRRLTASETMFRSIAENFPAIGWLSGTEGRAFWMNRAGRETFGDDGTAPDNAAMIVHPDDLAETMDRWTEALTSENPLEMTVRTRVGEDYRPMLSRATPVRDGDGNVTGWVGLQIDVTHERMRARGETLLREVSEQTRHLTDADSILERTCRLLGEHLRVGRVAMTDAVPDEEGAFLVRWDWTNGTSPSVTGTFRMAETFPALVAAYKRGETVISRDTRNDPLLSERGVAALASQNIRSGVSVPLMRDGGVAAVLVVQQAAPRLWSDDEVRLVEQIAERTWATLARAQAERALQERERNQAVLLAWSDAIRAESDPRRILELTLAIIGRTLSVRRVNFAEATETGEELVVQQDWVDGLHSVTGETFSLAALGEQVVAGHLTGAVFSTSDSRTDARFDPALAQTYEAVGARAFISVPLVRLGGLVGVLSVQIPEPRHWTEAEVSLLVEIAERTWAILERARSEERLVESEALLAAYLENAPTAMYLKDADGRYLRLNEEMGRVLDMAPDDALGLTDEELGRSELDPEPEAPSRAGRSRGVEVNELELGGEERQKYQSLLSIRFPIRGRAEAPERTGGFLLDLTARKRAEAALEQSREALYQSEKLTALGSLLAGVSHELNNPLSIVVAQAVMMERTAAGSQLADRAYRIRKAADRCARIVQTFLAMARQREPERKPVDVNAVVAAALELAAYGLRGDGVEVVTELASTLPLIAADADQLHQVVINLVINAQHAMAEGSDHMRRLTVRTGLGNADGVLIDIIDTGPGVPDAMRRRIFEPFFTTKSQGEGTGVGLSFSQGLVEAHGGRLILVPTRSGAHFRIILPIDATVTLAPDVDLPAPVTPRVRRRALIVDDEREIAESLCDFLGMEGFECDIAEGGRAALEKLTINPDYDLVVSDLRMPDLDGPALYAWIVEHRSELAERTAFATGDTLGSAAARFLAEVGRPVLEKPFMPEGVRRLLRAVDGASTV